MPTPLSLEETARIYAQLRTANPWLPEPEHVAVDGLTLSGGPQEFTTLTLTVLIEVPDEWRAVRRR